MPETIIKYLSQQELAKVHQKYGKPGEISPGVPGKKSKKYSSSSKHKEEKELKSGDVKSRSDDAV